MEIKKLNPPRKFKRNRPPTKWKKKKKRKATMKKALRKVIKTLCDRFAGDDLVFDEGGQYDGKVHHFSTTR